MSNVILKNGTVCAEVRMKGAQIISFKDKNGRERIYDGNPAVWPNHAPVLFPVCGSMKDDRVFIAGQKYPMTKHGFTRNPDFSVARVGEDFVDLVLTPTEESKPMYPFEFAFHVIYTLQENGYATTLMVENLSDREMPFCCGGHPGFACPMEDGESFDDYIIRFEKPENGINSLAPNGYIITGTEQMTFEENGTVLPISHQLFDERDALIFTSLASRSVELVSRNSGHGVRFDFPKMEVLAVWSKPNANAPYVCLEPWHGQPEVEGETGNLEDKPFVTILKPGTCWQGTFTATMI